MKKGNIILLIHSLTVFNLFGQFYNTGQTPSSIHWHQINTKNFQIIYPEGLYEIANRAANLLEYYSSQMSSDYLITPKKISVILNNQSVLSNGYTVWAPRRMEWVTTPPQESYPQDWIEQLAIHEFRHVVQLSNIEQGLTKLLKLAFGEIAPGAMSAFIPLWFLEGDAVMAETANSSTGRGRLSEFDKELRAIEQEQEKRFSYDQAYLGSYKFFIPNHYKYGYQIVTYGKLKYGDSIWNRPIEYVAKRPFLLTPFDLGLRKCIDKSVVSLYNQSFDSLNILWKNQKYSQNSFDTSRIYTASNKFYTNYSYVQKVRDKLFAVKTGIDDIAQFVLIDDSTECIIHTPGNYYGTKVSVNSRYAVWEEVITDIRWKQQNYSVLKLMNLNSGKISQISKKSRYFSPCLSKTGETLVCIEIGFNNEYSLIIIKIPEGEIISKININNHGEISNPVWIDSTHIAYIALKDNEKQIIEIDISKHEEVILFHAGYQNIDHLSTCDEGLFFAYDYELARNIVFLNKTNGISFLVTYAQFDADLPSYDAENKDLYYSDYTPGGYRPALKNLDTSKCRDFKSELYFKHRWAEEISLMTDKHNDTNRNEEKHYDSMLYRKFSHSLNLHSWAPFYFDPEDLMELETTIYPGFIFFSQNKLSTVTSSLGYYHKNHVHYLEPKITLEGLFPVFEIAGIVANKTGYYDWPDSINLPQETQPYYRLKISTYLPLNLTRNKYSRFIKPEFSLQYLNAYYFFQNIPKQGISLIGISLYGYNLLKKSYRDILPRFGQTVYYSYYRPFNGRDIFGQVIAISLTQYLPGLFRHDVIRLNFGYEEFDKNKSHLMNEQIGLPRGYDPEFSYDKNLKGCIDYTFPFAYPDWSIGSLFFIKRFHMTLYSDAARIKYNENTIDSPVIRQKTLFTSGIMLSSEMHFLRFFIPFTPRLKIAYIPIQNKVNVGFDINVNVSGF